MKVTELTWRKDQVEVNLEDSNSEKQVHIVQPRETELFGRYAKVEVYLEKDWFLNVREEVDSYHINLPDNEGIKPEHILERIERKLLEEKYTKSGDQEKRGQTAKDE